MNAENNVTLKIKTVDNLVINQLGGKSTIEGLDGRIYNWTARENAPIMTEAQEDDWLALRLSGMHVNEIHKQVDRPYATVSNAIGRAAVRKCLRDQARDMLVEESEDNGALIECEKKVKNLEALLNVLSDVS